MTRSFLIALFVLSSGCAKVRWNFPDYSAPPLLMAAQLNARAHSMVITVTSANTGEHGVILIPRSGTMVLPGGKRLYLLDHDKLRRGGGSNSVALPPGKKVKVRYDVLSDEVDFTELQQATIEWPAMLMDAKKGETSASDHASGGMVMSTGYTGTPLQLPPTIIRRE